MTYQSGGIARLQVDSLDNIDANDALDGSGIGDLILEVLQRHRSVGVFGQAVDTEGSLKDTSIVLFVVFVGALGLSTV